MPLACRPPNLHGSRIWSRRFENCSVATRSEESGKSLLGEVRPPTQEVAAFIDAHCAEFGVEPICIVLRSAGVRVGATRDGTLGHLDFLQVPWEDEIAAASQDH
jgi:hypothetical protein